MPVWGDGSLWQGALAPMPSSPTGGREGVALPSVLPLVVPVDLLVGWGGGALTSLTCLDVPLGFQRPSVPPSHPVGRRQKPHMT